MSQRKWFKLRRVVRSNRAMDPGIQRVRPKLELAQRASAPGVGEFTLSGGPVRLSPQQLTAQHGWISGATGTGKTVFAFMLVRTLIAAGVRVRVLDAKGGLARWTTDWARARGRPIDVIAPLRQSVPLNPCAPDRSMSPLAQSIAAADSLAMLLGHGGTAVGARMLSVLRNLSAFAISNGLSLLEAIEALSDPVYAAALVQSGQDRNGHLRAALAEPASSRASVLSRLQLILAHDRAAQCLCARDNLDVAPLLESPTPVVIDLGDEAGVPSSLRHMLGGILFRRLANAALTREVNEHTQPVLIVVDEWHRLLDSGLAAEFESLLSLSRSRRVHLLLINQLGAQVAQKSPEAYDALMSAAGWVAAFRQSPGDVAKFRPMFSVEPALLDSHGRRLGVHSTSSAAATALGAELTRLQTGDLWLWMRSMGVPAARMSALRVAEELLPPEHGAPPVATLEFAPSIVGPDVLRQRRDAIRELRFSPGPRVERGGFPYTIPHSE